MAPALKSNVRAQAANGGAEVRTEPRVSPTGFPFKVVSVEGTLSDPEVVAARPPVCDLGALRVPYKRKSDGKIIYRCPAEPANVYARKEGLPAQQEGRVCLCNALMATVGLGQTRPSGDEEPPLVSAGSDLSSLRTLSPNGESSPAAAVVRYLLGEV